VRLTGRSLCHRPPRTCSRAKESKWCSARRWCAQCTEQSASPPRPGGESGPSARRALRGGRTSPGAGRVRGGGAHARGARCWGRRLELRKDARFKEINRGRWLGLTREDINRDFPDDMAAFLRDPEWKGHGGESYSDLSARVLAGLDDAMAAAREQARPVARGCWWGGGSGPC